jgi:hypothetical protein
MRKLHRSACHLLDVIVLVAAIGVALLWCRLNIDKRTDPHLNPAVLFTTEGRCEALWRTMECYSPIVVLPMAAGFALALRANPGRTGRLARYPGIVACFCAALTLAIEQLRACLATIRTLAIHGYQLEIHRNHYSFIWWRSLVPVVVPMDFAVAIAVCWCVHTALFRARPYVSWVDLMGRVLGLVCIVWAVIEEVAPWSYLPPR